MSCIEGSNPSVSARTLQTPFTGPQGTGPQAGLCFGDQYLVDTGLFRSCSVAALRVGIRRLLLDIAPVLMRIFALPHHLQARLTKLAFGLASGMQNVLLHGLHDGM